MARHPDFMHERFQQKPSVEGSPGAKAHDEEPGEIALEQLTRSRVGRRMPSVRVL